ncbi:MAG: glycoside hydrolase family 6 protein [Actinobacteria bacterium]|nr:glycoside hydrolase family 6 protein [Actinomycetota bacterium]
MRRRPVPVLLAALALCALAAGPAAASPGPLAGVRFFTDPGGSLAGTVIRQIRSSRPQAAARLQVIADQPETKRFGAWDGDPVRRVRAYLDRVAQLQPGAVPLVSTYRLEHKSCGGTSDAPQAIADYAAWYRRFAQALGSRRVVVFLEIDALMTARCLSRHGLAVRVAELRSAIGSLASAPNAIVYVDGAAADVGNVRFFARVLRRIGVQRIAGVFLNGTHQDWTRREIGYGEQLARRLPGLRYVVNTATNGRGPLRPHDRVAHGNTIHCNPPGRGLGPRPTTAVPARYAHLDAFAWVGQPGRSAGACSATPGAPPSGTFWVDYALALIDRADYRIR